MVYITWAILKLYTSEKNTSSNSNIFLHMYNLQIYIHTLHILKAMKFKGCFQRVKKFKLKLEKKSQKINNINNNMKYLHCISRRSKIELPQ